MRMTRLSQTRAILPLMALCYYVPLLASFFWPTQHGRAASIFVWDMFPVWLSVGGWLVAASGLSPDTEMRDRIAAPTRDLPAVRLTVAAAAAASAAAWAWACGATVVAAVAAGGVEGIAPALCGMLLPSRLPGDTTPGGDFVTFTREFLQLDAVLLFCAAGAWLAYLFGDLKRAGMVRAGWLGIAARAAVSLVAVGPGATVALAWLWRELRPGRVQAQGRHHETGRRGAQQTPARQGAGGQRTQTERQGPHCWVNRLVHIVFSRDLLRTFLLSSATVLEYHSFRQSPSKKIELA